MIRKKCFQGQKLSIRFCWKQNSGRIDKRGLDILRHGILCEEAYIMHCYGNGCQSWYLLWKKK